MGSSLTDRVNPDLLAPSLGSKRGQGRKVLDKGDGWSWNLEAEGPHSSPSLRGRREANPADVVTVCGLLIFVPRAQL